MTETRLPAPAPQKEPGSADDAPGMAPAQPSGVDASSSPKRETADWRAGLDGDLRRVAAKFATPAEVVRSYSALEKRLGRSVVLPDRDSTPDEIEAFYQRLGRPKSPDAYDVHLPEELQADGADTAKKAFLQAMHRAGANGPTVQAAIDWYAAALADGESQAQAVAAEKAAESEAALRREWGGSYEKQVAAARRAVGHFGGAALTSALKGAGIADHPALLKAFAAIGAATAEDTLLAADAGAGTASAQKRIDRLMARHYGKDSYVSAAVQDELRALYGELYGSGAVPASAS
tara:strand:- start:113 stop:985 length:873 start_codon:yes stop_codon:yes gene_type:complete